VNLQILYFASLRDQAGRDAEAIVSSAQDASGLYAELKTRHGFSLDQGKLRVAINGGFAEWNAILRDGDEVVFLPPVSGG